MQKYTMHPFPPQQCLEYNLSKITERSSIRPKSMESTIKWVHHESTGYSRGPQRELSQYGSTFAEIYDIYRFIIR